MIEAQVVNVRTHGKVSKVMQDGTQYIYCGRPSRLGNPYWMKDESQRNIVIEKCDKDVKFHEVIKELKEELIKRNITKVHLGCFCYPRACHCDIIKRELEKEIV